MDFWTHPYPYPNPGVFTGRWGVSLTLHPFCARGGWGVGGVQQCVPRMVNNGVYGPGLHSCYRLHSPGLQVNLRHY